MYGTYYFSFLFLEMKGYLNPIENYKLLRLEKELYVTSVTL